MLVRTIKRWLVRVRDGCSVSLLVVWLSDGWSKSLITGSFQWQLAQVNGGWVLFSYSLNDGPEKDWYRKVTSGLNQWRLVLISTSAIFFRWDGILFEKYAHCLQNERQRWMYILKLLLKPRNQQHIILWLARTAPHRVLPSRQSRACLPVGRKSAE